MLTGRSEFLVVSVVLITALVTACDSSESGPDEDASGFLDASRDAVVDDAAHPIDASPSSDGGSVDGSEPQDALVSGDAEVLCEGLCLAWPVAGARGVDWVINNYVDLDTTRGGRRDYQGNRGPNARTYDNHRGVDIDIANFRAMDRGITVVAASPGTVRATVNDQMDRNTSCLSNDWNVVEVDGDDGHLYLYGHLRRGSVEVRPGDRVEVGTRLAQVGSSGCSTAAHLHFEMRNPAGEVVDPFLDEHWAEAPSYDTPLSIMDISLRSGAYSSVDELKDPGVDLEMIGVGQQIGIGLSAAGGLSGDRIVFEVYDPSGVVFHSSFYTLRSAGRHSWWMHRVNVGDTPGAWRVVGRGSVGERSISFDVTR